MWFYFQLTQDDLISNGIARLLKEFRAIKQSKPASATLKLWTDRDSWDTIRTTRLQRFYIEYSSELEEQMATFRKTRNCFTIDPPTNPCALALYDND